MSGEDDEDIDVDAILARAAALRARAAELDIYLEEPGKTLEPAPPREAKRRQTLVPDPLASAPDPGPAYSEPEPVYSEPVAPAEPPLPPEPVLPPDPFAAANAALARAREARGAAPEGPASTPAMHDDPFAAAQQALDRAEAARGVDLPPANPLHVSDDPLAAARAALEMAQQARSAFARVDSEQVLREAQLRAFKKRLQEAEDRLDEVEAARSDDA